MSLKVWAEWSACCALAFQVISAEAVAQTQDGATRTVESTIKKQRKQSKDAVVVTLSGDRNMQDVVRDLKASGLEVPKKDQELGAIEVVTGLAPSTSIAKLRRFLASRMCRRIIRLILVRLVRLLHGSA